MSRYVPERLPPPSTPTTKGLRFEVSPRVMRFQVSLPVGLLGEPYRTIRESRKALKKRLRATSHRRLPTDRLSTAVEVLYHTQSVEPTAHSAAPPPLGRVNATDSFSATCSPPPGRPRAPSTRPLAPASQGRTNQVTPRPRAPKCGRCRPRLYQSPTEPASRHFANRETKHPATPATQVTTPLTTGGIINSKHAAKTNIKLFDTNTPPAFTPPYQWGISHKNWNLLRRIEHGNTTAGGGPPRSTAADQAVCPNGHANAHGGTGAGPYRRVFKCLTCGKRFSQIMPSLLTPGQDPDTKWVAERPTNAQGTHASTSDQAWLGRVTVQATPVHGQPPPAEILDNGLLRAHAPQAQAPAAGTDAASAHAKRHHRATCVGDVKLIFQNRQGEASDPQMAFDTLERQLLPRAAVAAIVEAGWDAKLIATVTKRMESKGHRLYCAPAETRSPAHSVGAIVVRADVVRDPGERLVWRRPDGKALIIAVALAGVHYYVSAAHYCRI